MTLLDAIAKFKFDAVIGGARRDEEKARAKEPSSYAELSGRGVPEVLRWSLERFPGESLVLASSFGAEDVALIDLFAEAGGFPRVVTLDTGRLPEATHAVIEEIRRKYAIAVETYCPEPRDLEPVLQRHGANLFYESVALRRLCCEVRKVLPLRRALAGCRAWITGLRREQSAERAGRWWWENAAAKECGLHRGAKN